MDHRLDQDGVGLHRDAELEKRHENAELTAMDSDRLLNDGDGGDDKFAAPVVPGRPETEL